MNLTDFELSSIEDKDEVFSQENGLFCLQEPYYNGNYCRN